MFLYEAFNQIGVSLAILYCYCGPVLVIALSPILFHGLEASVSRTDDVDRGARTINLGHDVFDAGEFKDGADGATGDDASAGFSRF